MSLLSRALRVARQVVESATTERRGRAGARAPRPEPTTQQHPETPMEMRGVIPYEGPVPPLEYAPQPDQDADPGEIVWAWVPYDEHDGRGKDRPVLVIARHEGGYLGLQTTSKDHDRDAAQEAHWGRYWFDIGRGAWDSRGRESEVRLDRVLYLPAASVRREGAGLDRDRFEAVAAALQALRERLGER